MRPDILGARGQYRPEVARVPQGWIGCTVVVVLVAVVAVVVVAVVVVAAAVVALAVVVVVVVGYRRTPPYRHASN